MSSHHYIETCGCRSCVAKRIQANPDTCGDQHGIYVCYLAPGHEGRHVSRGMVAWDKS